MPPSRGTGDATASLIDLNRERARRGLSQDPWVGIPEIARHFGVSRATVYRWVQGGWRGAPACPHRRLYGGPIRMQVEAVSCWLDGESG